MVGIFVLFGKKLDGFMFPQFKPDIADWDCEIVDWLEDLRNDDSEKH